MSSKHIKGVGTVTSHGKPDPEKLIKAILKASK